MLRDLTLPVVVYVAGTGRSGSTALGQVLESELAVSHAGEVRYLWERGVGEDHLCECGKPFSGCPVWSRVMAEAHGDGVDAAAASVARLRPEVDRLRHVPGLVRQARSGHRSPQVAAYADLVGPVYTALTRAAGGEPVLDSSKDPSYLFALAATGGVDLRVLHLVRDSRAVAHSWTRRKRRPEIHWEEQFMRTIPPHRSAWVWSLYNATIESVRATGAPYVRVRYEDFARSPAATVELVRDRLGLQRRAAPPDRGRHGFSGNPMRFDKVPLQIRLDEAWRRELPAGDRRRVTALTAPLLAAYGYLGPGEHPVGTAGPTA